MPRPIPTFAAAARATAWLAFVLLPGTLAARRSGPLADARRTEPVRGVEGDGR